MLNTNYLPDNCLIKRAVINTNNGEQSKSYTVIVDSLPCRYYGGKTLLKKDNLSQETQVASYKVITPVAGIIRHDILELNNDVYIVEEVREMKLTNLINHLEIIISRK